MHSLRRIEDFRAVYDKGTALRSRHVVLIYLMNPNDRPRGAVVASKRVGNAVRRNRAKRLLRVARRIASLSGQLSKADQVLIAREGIHQQSSRTIVAEVLDLYRSAGLLSCDSVLDSPGTVAGLNDDLG